MTRDEILAKLYSIQSELFDIYVYAENVEDTNLMKEINTAEVAVEEALNGFYVADSDSDGQPDEAQEWHDFDPEC